VPIDNDVYNRDRPRGVLTRSSSHEHVMGVDRRPIEHAPDKWRGELDATTSDVTATRSPSR
jgi:hypothetical protein